MDSEHLHSVQIETSVIYVKAPAHLPTGNMVSSALEVCKQKLRERRRFWANTSLSANS